MDNEQLKMDNYQLPKGYKNTEVGVIPEDWDVKRLGEIATIIGGGTPSTNETSFWNGNINWFTPTEIGLKKYSDESVRKITKIGLENSSARLLPVGTILLTTRAGIGDISILMSEACTNQGFQSFVVNDGFDNEYIYYLISTLKNTFIQNASGSTFLEISPKKIKAIQIAIPTKSEQTAIANALSDTDALINSLEKLIAKKRNIKQGAMQQLLKPKEGWKVKKLGEICDIKKGEQLNRSTLNENDHYPVFNGGVLPSGYTGEWNQNENTIIISEGGNSCGFVNFIKTKFWQGGHCYSLNTKLDKEYFYQMLKAREKEIMALRVGSGLPNIQRNRLFDFLIIMPGEEEQNKIATILSDMDAEIQALETKLEKYRKIKLGMMQNLLTGKIRLV